MFLSNSLRLKNNSIISARRSSQILLTYLSTGVTGISHGMFALDSFCLRQFKDPANVAHISISPQQFIDQLNGICAEQQASSKEGNILKDGYAPFCKHVFVKNFTDLKVNTLPINAVTRFVYWSVLY